MDKLVLKKHTAYTRDELKKIMAKAFRKGYNRTEVAQALGFIHMPHFFEMLKEIGFKTKNYAHPVVAGVSVATVFKNCKQRGDKKNIAEQLQVTPQAIVMALRRYKKWKKRVDGWGKADD